MRPAFGVCRRATDLSPRVISTCEGCDDPAQDDLDLYAILPEDGGWQIVVYCPECADLASSNWTGATQDFRRVLPYDLFGPPAEEGAICPECSAVVGSPSECSSLTHPQRLPDLSTAIDRVAAIDDMDSDEWHHALAVVQEIIGQPDGTYASMYFDGREGQWSVASAEGRGTIIAGYVARELLP